MNAKTITVSLQRDPRTGQYQIDRAATNRRLEAAQAGKLIPPAVTVRVSGTANINTSAGRSVLISPPKTSPKANKALEVAKAKRGAATKKPAAKGRAR
jgi:hypothetical protein